MQQHLGTGPDPGQSPGLGHPALKKPPGVTAPISLADARLRVGRPELDRPVQRGFGGYIIERELGSGGMATVYLAYDKKQDRKVAIKVLNADFTEVLGVGRFLDEIKVTAHLQHPHILGLIDSGTIGDEGGELCGRPYYVMPFIEGESLRERLERDGPLGVGEAIRIATDVADALEYAHHHGIIHRDIKPGNILLLEDGSAILADFGIALAITEAGGSRLTESGLIVGTPPYMSPEQAAGEHTLTPRTDVYSLAVVTYEMLSGDPPFTGTTVQAVISKVLTEEPRSLSITRHRIPLHVDATILKALEKIPADRFASAHEYSVALNNGPTSIPIPVPTPDRYQHLLYAVTAAALLLLGFAAWGWLRPAPHGQVARSTLDFDSTDALAPLDDFEGRLAISPDGSHLVYKGLAGQRLRIRPRNQLRGVEVPGTEAAVSPFFSPDGKSFGGIVDRHALTIAPINGGPAIAISDSLVGIAGASWGSDGFIYVDASGDGRGLQRIEAKPGSTPRAFTTLDSGEQDHAWPNALPNAKGVIFTVKFTAASAAQRGSPSAIAVASVRSGEHRILIDNAVHAIYAESGHLLYVTTRNVLMAVPFDQNSLKVTGMPIALAEGMRTGTYGSTDLAISENGTLIYGIGGSERELVWMTRDGRMEPVDSEWRAPIQDPALSPDGKRLAVSIADQVGVTSVWIKQLDHGPSIKITQEGRTNVEPAWTPDGRSVTFVSDAGGPLQLWTKSANGIGEAKLEFHNKSDLHGPVWSRDGRWLLEMTDFNAPGANDIVGFRPGIDTAPVPLVASRFPETAPEVSPDGKWLAYTSGETGLSQVFVTPFPNTTSAKWVVSTRGGRLPRWSHSGRELFFIDSAGTFIAAELDTRRGFSVRRVTPLFQTEPFWLDDSGPGVPQYSVSPDDRRFIMVRPIGKGDSDRVIVVENWFDELKARSRK